MSNNVDHPSHYNQGGIECIDAIKSATVGKTGIEAFCVGNAIKYLWRFEEKNGLEDVKKAQFYINRLIQELENKEKEIIAKPTLDELYPVFDGEISNGYCKDCKYFNNSSSQLPCNACKYGSHSLNHLPLRFSPKDT